MQQTTKYQFKLIEGSDDFSPQPLNDNVEKIENALEGMEEALGQFYSPDNKPYVTGYYTGDRTYQEIILGFQPSFVIVSGDSGSSDEMLWQYSAVIYPNHSAANASITSNGFGVGDAGYFPNLSERYRTYYYIAFR